jgi:hypothetical protein
VIADDFKVQIESRRSQMSFDFDMSDLERKIVKALGAGAVFVPLT